MTKANQNSDTTHLDNPENRLPSLVGDGLFDIIELIDSYSVEELEQEKESLSLVLSKCKDGTLTYDFSNEIQDEYIDEPPAQSMEELIIKISQLIAYTDFSLTARRTGREVTQEEMDIVIDMEGSLKDEDIAPASEPIEEPKPVKIKNSHDSKSDYSYNSLEAFIKRNKSERITTATKVFDRDHGPNRIYYETGFKELDKVLGGGLPPGLTAVGAISSLGKSTFALQIARYMSSHNHHVLFFSLEMKRVDLAVKAISQRLYEKYRSNAKTVQELYSDDDRRGFSQSNWNAIDRARDNINNQNENFTVIECGATRITAEEIINYVKMYIKAFGVKPFVIIDYLQIIAPAKQFANNDKQAVDDNLEKFKILADREDVPILLISSFNRESYSEAASMRSFKDSGNIEYSADVLLGLQYQTAGSHAFDIEYEKRQSPRRVEVVVLKQRYGQTGAKISIPFHAEYNYFDNVKLIEDEQSAKWLINGRLQEGTILK